MSWYLPRYRVDIKQLARLAGGTGGRGHRVASNSDEDAVTLAVAAVRAAAGGERRAPDRLYFSTTRPTYLDKGQATIVAAAAGWGPDVRTYDFHGTVRSGIGALVAGLEAPGRTTVALADQRYGPPGSTEDLAGADAGVAITVSDDAIATIEAVAAQSSPLHDRWRPEGALATRAWDVRWSADQLDPLVDEVVASTLNDAGLTLDEVDHVALVSPNPRVGARLRKRMAPVAAPGSRIEGAGVAQPGLELAHLLSIAEPGHTILLVVAADGAEALLLRASDALPQRRPASPYDATATLPMDAAAYYRLRGTLVQDSGRRPAPPAPAAPAALRNRDWKFALHAASCDECGAAALPPRRVCFKCQATDRMTPIALADRAAVVSAFTLDHLASPDATPAVAAVLDFGEGISGRFALTDVDPDTVRIGDRIAMSFRVVSDPPGGPRNYFWKGRPVVEEDER
ncbi:hypothetical protein KG112_17260 [Nocardioides sp. zg-ZUI104]|uniref:OB-fold domain-containing protein n=1 Tax=Nocardioides faecalis TaxID=2803858 RepID=UPI001BD18915|nr:hypothetical protein [Nocardioides faecalis]MBS4754561.1 hypothetical protein [Nocardioides faecalis]